jgi:porin-like protein
MKKVLLGTSALALVGAFASPAAAQVAWDVRLGGYMTQVVGYGNSDANFSGNFAGVDVYSDAEVFFLPTITLDNGIKFGANLQLEGNTSGDQIDESYAFVKGSFGELIIGSENSAGYKMNYNAPNAGIVGINSGTMSAWIPFSTGGSNLFRATLGTTSLENLANNDAQRITYFTPRFAGFQVGGSYARDALQDSSGQVNSKTTPHDFFDGAVNYVNSFGDIDIAISGRAGIADDNMGADPTIWSIGTQIGFSGFTIGGNYAEQNGASGQRLNGEAWNVGVAYETGPWGFSAEYFDGTNQDNAFLGGPGSGRDENLQQFLVQGSYALATGVTLGVFGAYVDFDEDASNAQDIDGFVIGSGVGLSW